MTEHKSPLFTGQREKAGSETINKYLYQYHWALYQLITEHKNKDEYAVFIELHEDVVFCDSLDASKARFNLNQVKTTATAFNTYQLVKKKKSGKSVLGKLIASGQEKPFSKSINKINLVSTKDYALTLANEDVKLKTITKKDLSNTQLEELEKELKTEIELSAFPDNIQFIVTGFPEEGYQLSAIGAIAELISSIFPDSYTDAKNIYTTLIDELIRKGKESYDFTLWGEVLKNKALTSITVVNVIEQFTNIKNEANVEIEFSANCKELGYNTVKAKLFKRVFSRYRAQRISNSSVLQVETTKSIVREINESLSNGCEDIATIVDYVSNNLSANVSKQFTSDDERIAAILCEFIMMN